MEKKKFIDGGGAGANTEANANADADGKGSAKASNSMSKSGHKKKRSSKNEGKRRLKKGQQQREAPQDGLEYAQLQQRRLPELSEAEELRYLREQKEGADALIAQLRLEASEEKGKMDAAKIDFDDVTAQMERAASRSSTRRKALEKELAELKEELMVAKFEQKVAKEEVEKLRSSSDSNSSATDAELRATKDAFEEHKKASREQIERMKESLVAAEFAEHEAKEENSRIRNMSDSGTTATSSTDAEQLKATQEAFEEHKVAASREKRQLELDKSALKSRLAELVEQVDGMVHDKKGKAVQRLDETNVTDPKIAAKDKKIARLLGQVKDLTIIKNLAEDELKNLQEGSSSSGTNELALIRQIENLRAQKRNRATSRMEEIKKSDDILEELKAELKAAHDDATEKKLASDDLLQLLRAKLNAAKRETKDMYDAKVLAEGELKKLRDSSASDATSTSGSSEADLMRQIKSLEREKRKLALKRKGELKISDDALADMSLDLDMANKEIARLRLKDTASTIENDDDLLSQIRVLKLAARRDAERRAAEKKSDDDKAIDMKEQLNLLREQAKVIYDAKVLAEDELKGYRVGSTGDTSTSGGGGSSGAEVVEGSDALLLRQIEQLHAEKQLTQRVASAMKTRLEGRLATLQEEVGVAEEGRAVAEAGRVAADEENARLMEPGGSSNSGSLSADGGTELLALRRELRSLRNERKLDSDEAALKRGKLLGQVEKLENEVKAARYAKLLAEGELEKVREYSSSSESDKDMVKELEASLSKAQAGLRKSKEQELKYTSEKEAAERRLEMSEASNVALGDKLKNLQDRMTEVEKERNTAEMALAGLQSSDQSVSSEGQAIAGKLNERIRELESERLETMKNFRSLEAKMDGVQTDVQEEMNVLRNTQISSLMQEIETLEKKVDAMASRNKELERASEAYGRDQDAWLVKGNESENDSEKSGVLSDDVEKLTTNIETLRHRLSLALQNGEDARSAEKSKRDMVQDLQTRMDKTLLQLETMKLTNRRMKKDHSAALKAAKKCASDNSEEELAVLRALVRKCEEEKKSLSSQLDSATTASLDLTQVTDDDLIEKNKELRQKNKLLNKEISASRQNLIDNQENTMKVMRQYEKLRKDKEQTDEQLRQEKSKNVGLEQSITAMKTSSSISLSQSKKEAKSSEEQLRKRIHTTEQAHEHRIALLEGQIAQLQEENADLHDKNNDMARRLEHVAARHHHSVKEEHSVAEIVKLQAENEDLRKLNQDLRANMSDLEQQIESWDKDIKCVADQIIPVTMLQKDKEKMLLFERENAALWASIKECQDTLGSVRTDFRPIPQITSGKDEMNTKKGSARGLELALFESGEDGVGLNQFSEPSDNAAIQELELLRPLVRNLQGLYDLKCHSAEQWRTHHDKAEDETQKESNDAMANDLQQDLNAADKEGGTHSHTLSVAKLCIGS